MIDFGDAWNTHLPLVKLSYINSYHTSIKITPFEKLNGWKCHSQLCWEEVGDTQLAKKYVGDTLLTRQEIIHETTNEIVKMNERLRSSHDHQKKYTDFWQKQIELQLGDRVMLREFPWKGVIIFGNMGKLNPWYIGPFENLAKIGPIANLLALPLELNNIHNVFRVSNLMKCLSEYMLVVPLDEIQVETKLNFVEEPVKIIYHEVKRLKQSRIPILKVRWNSKQVPEYTWEREHQMRRNYPHLFENTPTTS